MLQHFGLTPATDLLDIGCGLGRLAFECASYLDDDATYTGFDIAPVAIEWLKENYAPRACLGSGSTFSKCTTSGIGPTRHWDLRRSGSRTMTTASTWSARSRCSCTSHPMACATTSARSPASVDPEPPPSSPSWPSTPASTRCGTRGEPSSASRRASTHGSRNARPLRWATT
ncbi:MAG: methyltransferase domain-containing protein [Acidimicrobiia bacterium]|nr:methyltransferase domain-containing protein [Acidimicrobiia bacterium]